MTVNLHATLADGRAESDRTFLDLGDQQLSYGEVFDRAARTAGVLADLGVDPGDRVVVQVPKSVDALVLYLACLHAGAVQVPLNTAYTLNEVEFFVTDAQPSLVVGDSRVVGAAVSASLADIAWAAEGRQPVAPAVNRGDRDLAMMLYTSGTTGRSKGAMLSHRALVANARGLHQAWGFRPDDRLVHVLPIFHVHGLFVALHCAILASCEVRFFESFDVDATIDEIPRSTVMMGVPTNYTRLLASERLDRRACAGMRLFTSGSAPMTAPVHDEFASRTGHRIVERYGMTESGIITTNPLDGDRVAGTVGYPLPHTEVRVRIDDERDADPGQTGVVEVRGPGLFEGYWGLPEKTAAEIRPGGWFVTGDVGSVDTTGRLTLEGRAGDMIISGGYNIYPKEIELVLDAVDGVVESAVVGIPHDDFGEQVVAVIAGTPDPGALAAALDTHLARFKHPRRLEFVDALPRNAMGKVQKAELRRTYSG